MRCLSIAQAEALLSPNGFSITVAPSLGRCSLLLKEIQQQRVNARPPPDILALPHFIRTLNRWLPSNSDRLLWINNWEHGIYGFEQSIVTAAHIGLGEHRPFEDTPGYLFDRQNWAEEDQAEVSPDMAGSLGLLVGLVCLLMSTGSEGWLISTSSLDRIEFWDGNLFFHSQNRGQLKRANAIIDQFGCSRDIE